MEIFEILILFFLTSVGFHTFFIVKYFHTNKEKYFSWYIYTAFNNVFLTCLFGFMIYNNHNLYRDLNAGVFAWIFSGIIMFIMLLVKMSIFRTLYLRAKDPSHYHRNFFGRKVLHPTVINKRELIIFFSSIPFFLFTGAYFVARLLNILFN